MALRWIEGFETFGPSGTTGTGFENGIKAKYNMANTTFGAPDASIVDGRGSGLALSFGDVEAYQYFLKTLDAQATWVVGFALLVPTDVTGTSSFFELIDGANGVQIALGINGADLRILRGTSVLDSTPISRDVWYYVELQATIHNSAGAYEVRLNGATAMSASGTDTQATANAFADRFRFLSVYGNNVGVMLDDVVVLDGTGSVNNTFLGDVKVTALFPNGDVAGEVDFAHSGGATNSENVDESPSDGDTTYVESGTGGDRDLYEYTGLAGDISAIKGIQINTLARVTDAQSQTLITPCKSNATVSEDAGVAVGSTSYLNHARVMEQDPDTGGAWTAGGVNAAQFGVKVG